MIDKSEVYCIGRLGKPHGVKGEISFQFVDDRFDRIDIDYLILSIDHLLVPFFIEEYRFKSNEVALVKFCDIDTQQRAAELTGCEVYLPRPDADESEEFSLAQLVGFALIDNRSGKRVGEIASIDDSTANLLFELTDGHLVPASSDLVTAIDAGKRQLNMDIPEGLLD